MTPFFIHIPKTAGSSLRTLITLNYTPSEVASIYGDAHQVFDQCSGLIGRTNGYRLIQGHIPVGTHLNLGLKRASYFFFLRHPVDRHFSDVAHGLRWPGHGFHALLSRLSSDPMALTTVADKAIYYRNIATSYLSGSFFTRELDLTDFHRAAETVLTSEFVGLAERFNESALIMARKLGWKHVVYEKRNVGVNPLTQMITPEVRKACESRQAYDMALYHVACERFDEEAQSHGALLQEAAQQLQELVSSRQKAFPELENQEYLVGDPVQTQQEFGTSWNANSPLARWLDHSPAEQVSQMTTTCTA